MWQARLLGTLAVTLAAGSVAHAASDPLSENLRKLEERAHARTAPKRAPAPPPARPRRPRREARLPQARVLGTRETAPRLAATTPALIPGPAAYSSERIGAKVRAGDLRVSAHSDKGLVHIYLKQRLVSNNGNGVARVPDLAPGKYPVLLFSPGDGKRRTFWVTVRPGSLASLNVNL